MTKNSNLPAANLVIVILMLLVLGCSCGKLGELINQSANTGGSGSNTRTDPTPSRTTESSDKFSLTMATYNQIKTDMSLSDVEDLIGGKGTEITTTKGGGITFKVLKWEGEDFKSIILTFRNDKVMTKSQVGLDKK